MAWYHWIAAYMIIISAVVLWVVPSLPLWLFISLILAIALGVGMAIFLPAKDDEYI